jgi:DNA-directed RNA polymerase subunit RPC12/RpoP
MAEIVNRKFKCTGCSKELEILLDYPVCISCPSCNNAYKVYADSDLQLIPNYKRASNVSSVIGIGTKGILDQKNFKIIGHLRTINNLYITNEWLMLNDAKEIFWLVEANTKYYLFNNTPLTISPSTYKQKHAGNTVTIEKDKFKYLEITKQLELQFDGQIPENSFNESDLFKIELQNLANYELMSIMVFDKNNAEGFKGKSISLKELAIEFEPALKYWK